MSQEPTGIAIESGNLLLTGDSASISIKDALLVSRYGTTLAAEATMPVPVDGGNSKGSIKGRLHVNKRDLRGFLTKESYKSLYALPDSLLNIETTIRGNVKKIAVDTIKAEIPGIARIGASGEGSNLTNEKKRTLDILFAAKARHPQKIPRTNLPDSIGRNNLQMKGAASLRNGTYTADATIVTDNGTATAQGTYTASNNSYDAKVTFDKFALSRLLPDVPLHLLSMSATLVGKGTDLYSDTTSYICTAQIDTLLYDSLAFDNISLNARQDTSLSTISIFLWLR